MDWNVYIIIPIAPAVSLTTDTYMYRQEFFKLERVVRQGCPLSGSLFVPCAEILAHTIRNNNTIKGIELHDKEFKLSQYADDTTAFVSDMISATNLFKLLSNFQECSGIEINKSKTEGMWLGASFKNAAKPLRIAWPGNSILALEINSCIVMKLFATKILNRN